jgi:hypothetical protein
MYPAFTRVNLDVVPVGERFASLRLRHGQPTRSRARLRCASAEERRPADVPASRPDPRARARATVSLVWGILVIVAADAVAVAAMLLLRRGAPEGGYFSDSDRASGVFGVLATGFAIFAGFVIFLAFTKYDDSRAGAESEALTIVQQYETAQFLPAKSRGRLTGELVCYARSTVHQEWPRMEDGSAVDSINPWGVALLRSLQLTTPRTPAEQSAYDKWSDLTTDRVEARRDRIYAASGIIPTSLWLVLFLLGGVLFAYILFYADSAERARAQAMLIASATTAIAVTLLAVYALDNPYRPGVGSIQPVAMERTLRILDEARAALDDSSALPCDEAGVAR